MTVDEIPLPDDEHVRLEPPDAPEVQRLADGVLGTIRPDDGALTPLQIAVTEASFAAMTGHRPDTTATPSSADALAAELRTRNHAFRARLVQQALLGALISDPISVDVIDRLTTLAARLGVDEGMITTARQFADRHYELAAIDFDRNGYTADWDPERAHPLHSTGPLDTPWRDAPDDPDLAARWRALESLGPDTLGGAVSRFYRARGFAYPGTPGSVSPLLAQHDWVHVLADYGSIVDNELEVFAFIARANDDPRGFSFLAMVVSLFETGVLASGAGLFEPDPGHLRRSGMPERLADAMLRGARCEGSIDFLALDWFTLASRSLGGLRSEFGITPKSPHVDSPGPFETGGINEFQLAAGRALADRQGRPYESWGAAAV